MSTPLAGAAGGAVPSVRPRAGRRALATVLAPLALLAVAACSPGLEPMVRSAPVPATAPAAAAAPAARPGARLGDADYLRERQLMVPVAGVEPSGLRDSFDDARDGGARRHRAIDIMAPRGTPVLAADEGRVYRVASNRLGGLTVYVLDATERFMYYYAHLDAYRDGLRAGMRVARGEVLGYVGTTGNAPEHVPHLHFQAMRYRRDRYWDGEPVNPLPFLLAPGQPLQAISSTNQR
jgi:murein DD-endopeptidase MepM/ murein hydrolase activator NlpD